MVLRWAYAMHNAGYQSKPNSEFLKILVQQVVSDTMNMCSTFILYIRNPFLCLEVLNPTHRMEELFI